MHVSCSCFTLVCLCSLSEFMFFFLSFLYFLICLISMLPCLCLSFFLHSFLFFLSDRVSRPGRLGVLASRRSSAGGRVWGPAELDGVLGVGQWVPPAYQTAQKIRLRVLPGMWRCGVPDSRSQSSCRPHRHHLSKADPHPSHSFLFNPGFPLVTVSPGISRNLEGAFPDEQG